MLPSAPQPRSEQTSNRSRWTIERLDKRLRSTVQSGLEGRGLHYTRALLGRILQGVPEYDDQRELQAIYDFLKDGGTLRGQVLSPGPGGLPGQPWEGLRYLADPREVHPDPSMAPVDFYSSLHRLIEMGVGDCDEHTTAALTLLKGAGFRCAARYCNVRSKVYKRNAHGELTGGWSVAATWHVHALAAPSKSRPGPVSSWRGWDTTMDHGLDWLPWRTSVSRIIEV